MQVRPRGGVKEVGRSCLHVTAGSHDFLIDCGLKQSAVTEYPDFSKLSPGQIDAVFLTHAHVDHIGGLPLLSACDLMADNAPIIATRPTDALTTTMLWDSFKLHKMEARERNIPPQYQEGDVQDVLDRIEGVPYGQHTWHDVRYEFGSASHLLGSAWLALEHEGTRALFSGDLGGRSGHLPNIEEPSNADALFLESTYGDTMTHPSFRDARSDVFKTALEAAKRDNPVLIPTFGMGRAQELFQIFRERASRLPDGVELVYDGLIEDSMNVYHAFASDPWVNDTILNYKINSGDAAPFLPDDAFKPKTMEEREALVDGDRSPIIIAPSGMLTGGWSPFYLWKLTENYDDARVLFVGYQASDTPGRDLLDEPSNHATITISALMYPEEADKPIEDIIAARNTDANPDDFETEDNDLFDFYEKTIEVPTDWAQRVSGLSGHADANTLLQFARDSEANQIHLVHGEPHVAEQLRGHLDSNTNASAVHLADRLDDIDVTATGAVVNLREELDVVKAERARLKDELDSLDERIQDLEHRIDEIDSQALN